LEAPLPAEGGNFLIDGDEILRQLEEDPETRPREDGTVWIGQMPVVVMGEMI